MKTSLSSSFTLTSRTQLTTIKMIMSQLCSNQIMIKHSISECCTMPYKTIQVPNLFFVDLFQATSDVHLFEILAMSPRWKLLSFHHCILRLGNLHIRNNTTLCQESVTLNSVITKMQRQKCYNSKVMKQLTVVPSDQARATELHDIYKALSDPPKHMFLH